MEENGKIIPSVVSVIRTLGSRSLILGESVTRTLCDQSLIDILSYLFLCFFKSLCVCCAHARVYMSVCVYMSV